MYCSYSLNFVELFYFHFSFYTRYLKLHVVDNCIINVNMQTIHSRPIAKNKKKIYLKNNYRPSKNIFAKRISPSNMEGKLEQLVLAFQN